MLDVAGRLLGRATSRPSGPRSTRCPPPRPAPPRRRDRLARRSRRRCRGVTAPGRRSISAPLGPVSCWGSRAAGRLRGEPVVGWRGAPRSWRRRVRSRCPSNRTAVPFPEEHPCVRAAAASSRRTRARGTPGRRGRRCRRTPGRPAPRPATASSRSRWLASGSCRPVSSPSTTRAGRSGPSTSDVQPVVRTTRPPARPTPGRGPRWCRPRRPGRRPRGWLDQPGGRRGHGVHLRLRRLVRLLAGHPGVQHQRRDHDAARHQVDQHLRGSGRPALGISALPGPAAYTFWRSSSGQLPCT